MSCAVSVRNDALIWASGTKVIKKWPHIHAFSSLIDNSDHSVPPKKDLEMYDTHYGPHQLDAFRYQQPLVSCNKKHYSQPIQIFIHASQHTCLHYDTYYNHCVKSVICHFMFNQIHHCFLKVKYSYWSTVCWFNDPNVSC